jgi:enoyl-CoA hydratase/carnithine racemase
VTVQTIELSTPSEAVLLATLNRPDRLNAMTPGMFDDLEELGRHVTASPEVRVVVITGAGRGFCAGFDLDEATTLASRTAQDMLALQEAGARAMLAIRSIRVPVIAAVNGAAAGGGLSLALTTDIRLASPTAKFNAAFTKIGLSAGDMGASWLLPRIVGPAHAADIAYTGRQIGADEAERMRLVNRVVRDGTVLDAALELATRIAANSPAGVRMSKTALQANQETASYSAALELENRGQTLLTRTEDMTEALGAFLDKRRPKFSNR